MDLHECDLWRSGMWSIEGEEKKGHNCMVCVENKEKCEASTDEAIRVPTKNLTWTEVKRGEREIMTNSIIITIETNKDRVS